VEKNKVNAQFLTLNYKPYEGWGRHQQLIQEHIDFLPDSSYKLVLSNPYDIPKKPTDKIIFMSTFEADRLPQQFIGPANEATAIIVPDTWVKEVFINSGVRVPVYVMPEGITDNTVWHPDQPPFTFLHFDFTSEHDRKGGKLVLSTFISLFGNMQNKAKLIIKGRDHHVVLPQRYPNVEYIFQNYTQSQMDDLWQRTHCFVFPSKGEGFGLPPLEAMGHGIPTIVTSGSAMKTFSYYGIPLGVTKKIPAQYEHYTGYGKWDMPDVKELGYLMQFVYDNYSKEKTNAEFNSHIIWQNYNFANIAPKLAELINAIVEEDGKTRVS
jgi:hypothetical protein